MKSLLWNLREYDIKVVRLANRPEGIKPEEISEKEQRVVDCILVFVTVEKGDELEKCSENLVEEIIKFVESTKRKSVVICPFAHLSNNLAEYKECLNFFEIIERKLELKDLNVFRSHFGSDKELLMRVVGHVGAVRFREF